MKKRGVSTVIAVVLIIAIVLSLSVVVFTWSKNLVSKTTTQASAQKLCSQVSFRAADFCYSSVLITDVIDNSQEKSVNIRFNVENTGNEDILGFLLKLDDNSGNSKSISTIPYNDAPAVPIGKQLTSDFLSNTSTIAEIHVIPIIKSDKETINCNSEEQIIDAGGIVSC